MVGAYNEMKPKLLTNREGIPAIAHINGRYKSVKKRLTGGMIPGRCILYSNSRTSFKLVM